MSTENWNKVDDFSANSSGETIRAGAIAGVLLGGAVGDAIALPFEGLSAGRIAPKIKNRPLGNRLFFGCGMFSDDTEHACMTAQALLLSRLDADRFAKSLSWRLRWWLLGMPAAIGLATLRAICRLWLGFSWKRCGVNSAGNGPAMRASIIGAVSDDLPRLHKLIANSTKMTHRHPAALEGALAVAIAAHRASRATQPVDATAILDDIRPHLHDADLVEAFSTMQAMLPQNRSVADFVQEMNWQRGPTGYIAHSVPVAIYAWLCSPCDYRTVIRSIVELGGDTDSNAAIAGALVGATAGPDVIPPGWRSRIIDWPRSAGWILKLAQRFELPTTQWKPLPLFWPMLIVRNIVFLCIVLLHGVARLLRLQ